MAKPIMIMGCTSDAGKSFLVTALCRHFANRGARVAPFKAQNMSNNAAVTPDGLEIGRAQYLQALAAQTTPQAQMNPVLLKPSAETYSQVIVLGKFDPEITAMPWMERRDKLWPIVQAALHNLLGEYDQVVIEGAGSPAEINLRAGDIVNMAVALDCEADVYLVADIDRGGAFAHLLGTWSCLETKEQALIKGFVLNKFRGDPALLGNATEWLEARTGIPTVAIIPMLRHTLPDEDTLHHRAVADERQINIALIAYPYASNLDEFDPLIHESGINVVPIREFAQLDRYHAVILPGSKNTVESLRYLRQLGLAAEISRAAARGIPVLGICGGLQLLGKHIHDPQQLEGGSTAGLGLLDVETTLIPDKITTQRTVSVVGDATPQVKGYEIHHGVTHAGPNARPHLESDLGWQQGNIWGVYLHGILENTVYRQRFLARLGWQGQARDWDAIIDEQLDGIAKIIPTSGWFE
ncbi:MAG: cobyric acid synthase [Aggregatilineales bacterium]